ncbi:MAG: OsmC family protein [Flavobacteriaceae bacterium]|nr:OsmC family protein [Flavobacteriaceae bacterium]
MIMKRKGTAVWNGTLKEGKGTLSTQSGVLKNSQYSFSSRFEEGIGTNPEELVGAAHAGCFTMQLSANLTKADFTPGKLETTCEITLEAGTVTKSHLTLTANVPGIDKAKFDEIVADAKKNCPISKLLNAEITLSATLV